MKAGGNVKISDICLLIMCTGAAISDLRTWKIPNIWLFCFCAGAFCVRLVCEDAGNVADGAIGMIIPLVILGWLFLFRMMGAGDIKLLCTAGAWVGADDIWLCMLWAFIAAAAIVVFKLVKNRNIKERFLYLRDYLKYTLRFQARGEYIQMKNDKECVRLAAAVCISAMLKILGVYG